MDWTQVSGATGYKVQWNTSDAWGSPSEHTITSGSTVTYTIDPTPALTEDTQYYVRVLPTKSGADEPPSDVVDVKTHATTPNATVDYDADNDGLIEITTLAQLNAIRYDLDGDGVPIGTNTEKAAYKTAFLNAEDNMGCNESVASITAGPGNPVCTGYELRASLDFNTNNSAKSATNPTGANLGDTYWNSGAGWLPIGMASASPYTVTAYTGSFDGNADADPGVGKDGGPYTISNLFIDRTAGKYAGLFAYLNGGSGALVEDVALVNVDVTLTPSGVSEVDVGGLAGRMGSAGVNIEDSYTTGRVRAGESASKPVTFTGNNGISRIGGLVGRSDGGNVTASYSLADVTGYSKGSGWTNIQTFAGGLVGYVANAGIVTASYAGGAVSANIEAKNSSYAYAGGLVGYSIGSVTASYARGAVSAYYDATDTTGITGQAYAGGLAAYQSNNITASFSTGAVTATGDGTPTAGGLVSNRAGGTTTNSYWDTETSGITATGQGTGKTTAQLQGPTSYSSTTNNSGTAIYTAWNLNLDGVTGGDDPWDFGTASQYPALKFGPHVADDQRVKVTLSVNPATIWERALTASQTPTNEGARVNASTVTATLDKAWNAPIVVTLPTNAAYKMNPTTITIAAGSTTGTSTLTAVNNFVDAANNAVTLTQATHPADTTWAYKGTDDSITINDDDSLAKPTDVKLSVDGTKIQVDWTAVTGANGYKVQWNSTSSTDWSSATEVTKPGASTITHKITSGLSADTEYYVRVLATSATAGVDEPPSDVVSTTTHATSPATVDYDADDDGLIEITTLAQLHAVRYDLDGNGQVASGDETAYDTAFSEAEDNMGCNETAATISSQNTGNPACTGYELAANLDFNTGQAVRTDDTYYNSGQGWLPIGATAGSATSSPYTAEFDGVTYKISNLYIDRSGSTTVAHAGLFAELGSAADVKNLSLEGVSVAVTTNPTATTPADVYAGGIAGKSSGDIAGSYALGSVKAVQSENTANNNEKHAYAGGLVGNNAGAIVSSYSRADVTAEQLSTTASLSASAGGIAGHQDTGGSITASFSTGDITAESRSAANGDSYAGGLLGYQHAGSVKAAYSHAYAEAKTSSAAATATLAAGGLVGHIQGGSVTASYSTGAPTTTGGVTPTVREGGLAGYKHSTGVTDTDNYWDTTTSGITATGAGTGKTTSELKTPTDYAPPTRARHDIYEDWEIDLDTTLTGTQDPWDFGTASQYPVLKYGLTAADQRATVILTANPATICETTKGSDTNACGSDNVISTTISAAISPSQQVDVVVTLPANAAYTLGATTITVPADAASSTTERDRHRRQQQDGRVGQLPDHRRNARPELGERDRRFPHHQGRRHPRHSCHDPRRGRQQYVRHSYMARGDRRHRLHTSIQALHRRNLDGSLQPQHPRDNQLPGLQSGVRHTSGRRQDGLRRQRLGHGNHQPREGLRRGRRRAY